jgi:hypothetical protein
VKCAEGNGDQAGNDQPYTETPENEYADYNGDHAGELQ